MIGWDRLKQITVGVSSPVSLADAKVHLRVTYNDEDAYITSLTEAARSLIDGPRGIGVCMGKQQWRMTLDQFTTRMEQPFGQILEIPLGPVYSVDAVKYIDYTGAQVTVNSANYTIDTARDPARLVPIYGTFWPVPRAIPGAVTIDFTAGYGINPNTGVEDLTLVPGALKVAMLHMISNWFENRSPVVGDKSIADIPFSVAHILNNFRVGRAA